MGILGGNPKDEPMHYGEVAGVWGYCLAAKASLVAYQTLLNHTGDKDLRNFIEDITKNMTKSEIQQTEKLLLDNGITPPPTQAEKPKADLDQIPVGARFMDIEISMIVSKNIAEGIMSSSTILAGCIREDIGAMFEQFHTKNVQYALTILRMNKEKGWLIPPPLHVNIPEPVHA